MTRLPRAGAMCPGSSVVGSRSVPAVPWWAWPSVLAVDAPAVAAAWLFAFGLAFDRTPDMAAAVVVAASVWLVYVADRLRDVHIVGQRGRQGDGRRNGQRSARSAPGAAVPLRHAFVARYRVGFAVAWPCVFSGAVALALSTLSASTLVLGCVVACLALAAIAWPRRSGSADVALRALTIGVAFAGAIVVGLDAWPSSTQVAALTVFAGACAVNLAFVAVWERALDDGYPTSVDSARFAYGLAAAMAAGSVALWTIGNLPLGLPLLVAVVALATIDRIGGSWPAALRSAAADLSLVLPLVVLLG